MSLDRLGRGGGDQMVNMLTFYIDNLSSNPTEACVWKEP